VITWPAIDLVACLELPDIDADTHDRSSQIMAENERWAIRQEQLEFAVAHLGIEKVDRGGLDANQHIIGTDVRIGHVGQTQRAVLLVCVDDEGFHALSPV